MDDKSACHAQTCLGSKVVGDHDPEAGLGEPIMWRAWIYHLVHHHNRAPRVCFTGLYCGHGRKKNICKCTYMMVLVPKTHSTFSICSYTRTHTCQTCPERLKKKNPQQLCTETSRTINTNTQKKKDVTIFNLSPACQWETDSCWDRL